MLEFIKEKDIWQTLKESDLPTVLYGMGLGAEKVMANLQQQDIEVRDVFASDEFVRGHYFKGFKVMKYSEICEKYDDFNVVLCFASHIDSVIEKIEQINKKHTVYAPDVPVAGGGLFCRQFVKEHEKEFDFAFHQLADEESRRVYLDIINFKISGKIEYLLRSFGEKEEVYQNILQLNTNENILDLGAYDGDTIREFLSFTGGRYQSITALEPDKKNFKKLLKNTDTLKNIKCLNMGAWNQKDTLIFSTKAGRNSRLSAEGEQVKVTDIDSLNIPATFIKMDIEGSELKALDGMKQTIKNNHPKLYVCAYHRNEDLYSLPAKILKTDSSYKIYFRHSKYIPAWESNFYCI